MAMPTSAPTMTRSNTNNPKRPRKASFVIAPVTLDLDDSPAPSPPLSPPSIIVSPINGEPMEKLALSQAEILVTPNPGTLPPDMYETMMGPWRAAVRRVLVRCVERESKVIARMQDAIRTPFLDSYFVYTSSLGTHTFFMTALPMFCFFGYPAMARGLIFVLAGGVYASSFIKDLFCSPRPFAPPVTRLTIGSHHLEYGFPSTHSTNSVSIALFILENVIRVYNAGNLSQTGLIIWSIGLSWYLFSIVFGRLYTAMHSFVDCICGVLLGTAVWATHFYTQDLIAEVVTTGGWSVPATVTVLAMVLVHKHPQPVDDCPCFEDAIAFVSVVLGVVLGWWHGTRAGWTDSAFITLMPGSNYQTWEEIGTWWAVAALKTTVGIIAIFVWRLIAKVALHAALPPTFRLLSRTFVLPHRRFYTPATDYARVPVEGLRPIPSVIDLPGHRLEAEQDVLLATAHGVREGIIRRSNGRRREASEESGRADSTREKDRMARIGGVDVKGEDVKHYDADVLTKIGVYAGIGLVATYGVPVAFEVVGLGVGSSL